MFRERRGNTYYETGSWTTDPAAQPQELWYCDQELELLTNPVDLGQTVFGGQQVAAKGSTSVPAGTFEAFEFLFYSETEEEGHVETVERIDYFAPHVGIVATYGEHRYTDKDTGDTYVSDSYVSELVSYSPGS